MKRLYLLFSLSAFFLVSNANAASNGPSDTLRETKYSLSSRNAEAQTGKYKKLDLGLGFNANARSFTLTLASERDIDAYVEITDQDENVIYFKQTRIKEGNNELSFVAEDGHQSLFRVSISEPSATKPAVFIIREEDGTATVATDVIR